MSERDVEAMVDDAIEGAISRMVTPPGRHLGGHNAWQLSGYYRWAGYRLRAKVTLSCVGEASSGAVEVWSPNQLRWSEVGRLPADYQAGEKVQQGAAGRYLNDNERTLLRIAMEVLG